MIWFIVYGVCVNRYNIVRKVIEVFKYKDKYIIKYN